MWQLQLPGYVAGQQGTFKAEVAGTEVVPEHTAGTAAGPEAWGTEADILGCNEAECVHAAVHSACLESAQVQQQQMHVL